MPCLTRRRSDNPHRETWDVSYGDVRVGTIGERAGIPVGADQWGWSCGFYPGLEPRRHREGTAKSFIEARAGFEADWNSLLPELSDGAFEAYRRDRAFRAEIRAIHDRGEKLPTEIYSSLMRCVCGVVFDSHKPDESYDHRGHIHAARGENPVRVRRGVPTSTRERDERSLNEKSPSTGVHAEARPRPGIEGS